MTFLRTCWLLVLGAFRHPRQTTIIVRDADGHLHMRKVP